MTQGLRAAVMPFAGFFVRRAPATWVLAVPLLYAPLLLFVDARLGSRWPGEYLLGILTFAVLYLCSQAIDERERHLVWMCVAVATAFEILGSLVWGGYRYRFGRIPLFVPFGHGLIYAFGARLAATELVRRHERVFTRAVFAVATAWAIGGITIFPGWTHRYDLHGLLWLPIFAYAVLCSPRGAFFAALFIATTEIELVGTSLGNWTWAATTPWFHALSGNPPSAIAGGYAIIDGSMLQLAALLQRLRDLRMPRLFAPSAPAYATVRAPRPLRIR